MHQHGVYDNLFRNRQEQLVECSHHSCWVLNQVHHFSHDLCRKLGNKAGFFFDIFNLLANDGLALHLGRNHVRLLQNRKKVIGRGNFERTRRQETMSARGVASSQAGKVNIHHFGAQQGQKPTHRAAELVAQRTPTLGTRPRQARNQTQQQIGQQVGNALRWRALRSVHVLNAVFFATFKIGRINALAARKTQSSFRGIAFGVERDFRGRALEHFLECFRLLGDLRYNKDQAARRGMHRNRLIGNARSVKCLVSEFFKLDGCVM